MFHLRAPIPLLVASAALVLPVTWASSRRPAAAEEVELTGDLAAWHLEMDSRVYLQLNHAPLEDGRSTTWFHSPPRRNAEDAVDHMLLEILLEAHTHEHVLVVRAKSERALDGSSPEEALPLIALGAR